MNTKKNSGNLYESGKTAFETLSDSVLTVLRNAEECLGPQQISEALRIPPIRTKCARSQYLIVNSILCLLEEKDQVRRCPENDRKWESILSK